MIVCLFGSTSVWPRVLKKRRMESLSYLADAKDVFPHIIQSDEKTSPLFEGTVQVRSQTDRQ